MGNKDTSSFLIRLALRATLIATAFVVLLSNGDANETIDVPIHPITGDKSVQLKPVDAPDKPSEEASELYRKAKLDTWTILGERNVDRAFDNMLRNQPNNRDERIRGWIDFMQTKYEGPIQETLKARRLGRTQPIPTHFDDEGNMSLLPVNGCLILEQYMYDFVSHEMYIDGPDSVATNLPLVISIVEDWCHGEDAPVFGVRHFESLLDRLATEPECPDFAEALWKLDSPYRALATYHTTNISQWQTRLKLGPGQIERILDPGVADNDVKQQCEKLLQQFYTILTEEGENGIDNYTNLEDWMRSFDTQAQFNWLSQKNRPNPLPQSTSPARLGVATAYLSHLEYASEFQKAFQSPIADSIRQWNMTHPKVDDSTPTSGKRSSQISSECFLYWRPQPQQYWYSQQSIAATALLFELRKFFTNENSLPESIDSMHLPSPQSRLDPITGKTWVYERTTPTTAKLQLINIDGTPRKTLQLVCNNDSAK